MTLVTVLACVFNYESKLLKGFNLSPLSSEGAVFMLVSMMVQGTSGNEDLCLRLAQSKIPASLIKNHLEDAGIDRLLQLDSSSRHIN